MKRYIVAATFLTCTYGLTAMAPAVSTTKPTQVLVEENTKVPETAFAPQQDVVEKALQTSPEISKSLYDPSWSASEKHERAELWLAAMLFGECRGQREECMIAVGHVAMNRARENLDARYGKGLWGVINKRKAFSCLNKNDPNRKVIDKAVAGKLKPGSKVFEKWELAKKTAHFLMHVGGVDPTNAATHYHAPYVNPKWIGDRGMSKVAEIDGHIFYKKSG